MVNKLNSKSVIDLINLLKVIIVPVVAGAGIIVSIIFWIQTSGDDKYYAKLKGEETERQLLKLDNKLEKLENNNNEMILLLKSIEANVTQR